ncbi:MAG: flap structure-specific endonuclease, partial [Candidatus Bathyarchaeia archaeon]
KTIGTRREAREEATIRYKEAIEAGDLVSAKKYAQASTKLDFYIIETAKELLKRLGVPAVQAPGEGEAQAAYMTRAGLLYATASQDYDALLFGATRLVRNLAITGRRKLPNRNAYVEVNPEIIELDNVLRENEISWEQLIAIGLLVGTDFMPGIKGIGAKKALKLIKRGMSIDEIYALHGESKPQEFEEVFNIFYRPQVEVQEIFLGDVDTEAVIDFLVTEHDFSEDRVRKALEPIVKLREHKETKAGLSKWMF